MQGRAGSTTQSGISHPGLASRPAYYRDAAAGPQSCSLSLKSLSLSFSCVPQYFLSLSCVMIFHSSLSSLFPRGRIVSHPLGRQTATVKNTTPEAWRLQLCCLAPLSYLFSATDPQKKRLPTFNSRVPSSPCPHPRSWQHLALVWRKAVWEPMRRRQSVCERKRDGGREVGKYSLQRPGKMCLRRPGLCGSPGTALTFALSLACSPRVCCLTVPGLLVRLRMPAPANALLASRME